MVPRLDQASLSAGPLCSGPSNPISNIAWPQCWRRFGRWVFLAGFRESPRLVSALRTSSRRVCKSR